MIPKAFVSHFPPSWLSYYKGFMIYWHRPTLLYCLCLFMNSNQVRNVTARLTCAAI